MGTFLLTGLVLWLLVLCQLWPASTGLLIEQRLNYGTLFKPLPELYRTSEYWKHTFVIDLKLPSFNHSDLPKCDCPEISAVVKHLSLVHNETFKYANNIIKSILSQTKTAHSDPPRSRRSLLPFVGKIASGLFGLSTADDVRMVADNVNRIHTEQNRLKTQFHHEFTRLSSFMATSNDRIDNAMAEVLTNHDLITTMQQNFTTFAETIAEKQSWIFARIIDQTYNYNAILNSFQNLNSGFIALQQGQISPLLISKQNWVSALNFIRYMIRSQRPDFKLLHSSPSYYLNFADYAVHRSDLALLITVKFPISSIPQPFKLYQVIHYPLPLGSNSMHTTSIKNLPKYLAVSSNSFLSLPDNVLSDCDHHRTFTDCKANLPVQNITMPDCAMALYLSNKTAVKELCDFVFSPNSLKPTIRQVNQTHFLAVNSSKITLQCDTSRESLQPCHFCLIQIPCNCSIQTQHFILPKRYTDCGHHAQITTVHPVNLIMLQHFFGESKTQAILPSTTYPKPINITIRKFNMFEHKFQSMVLKDEKINLNLRKMIDNAKEDKVIYQDLAEPFLDTTEGDYTNTSLSVVSLAISCCAIIGLAVLFIKYRQLSSTLLLYQTVPQTAATTLPSFHYDARDIITQSIPSPIEHLHTHFLEFNEYIICLLALVLLAYALYRRCKPIARPILYMEISNGKWCTFCPILHLPTCVRDCLCIPSSSPPSLTLSLGLWSTLDIQWNNLSIQVNGNANSLFLPKSVRINPLLAYSIHRILHDAEPFSIHMWATHNQFCVPLDTHLPNNKDPSAPLDASAEEPLLYPDLKRQYND